MAVLVVVVVGDGFARCISLAPSKLQLKSNCVRSQLDWFVVVAAAVVVRKSELTLILLFLLVFVVVVFVFVWTRRRRLFIHAILRQRFAATAFLRGVAIIDTQTRRRSDCQLIELH